MSRIEIDTDPTHHAELNARMREVSKALNGLDFIDVLTVLCYFVAVMRLQHPDVVASCDEMLAVIHGTYHIQYNNIVAAETASDRTIN